VSVVLVLVSSAAYLAAMLALASFVAGLLRASSLCTCRRYAWDPACPVHGRQR